MADEPADPIQAEPAAPAAGEESAAAPVAAAAPVEGAPPADVVRPADLPESFWDDAAKAPKYGDIAARLTKADELEAALNAAKEGVPTEPGAYVFKPSGEPIKLPDGSEAEIDPANPLAQAIAAAAHKHGVPQAAVSDFARAFIETNIAGDAAVDQAVAAERAALGDKADDRVAATEAFLKANGATDDHIQSLRGFPSLVPLFEALQAKVTGAPIAAPTNQDGKPQSVASAFYPDMKPRAA